MADINNIKSFPKPEEINPPEKVFESGTVISSEAVNSAFYNVSLAVTALLNAIASGNSEPTQTYSSDLSIDKLTEMLETALANRITNTKVKVSKSSYKLVDPDDSNFKVGDTFLPVYFGDGIPKVTTYLKYANENYNDNTTGTGTLVQQKLIKVQSQDEGSTDNYINVHYTALEPSQISLTKYISSTTFASYTISIDSSESARSKLQIKREDVLNNNKESFIYNLLGNDSTNGALSSITGGNIAVVKSIEFKGAGVNTLDNLKSLIFNNQVLTMTQVKQNSYYQTTYKGPVFWGGVSSASSFTSSNILLLEQDTKTQITSLSTNSYIIALVLLNV